MTPFKGFGKSITYFRQDFIPICNIILRVSDLVANALVHIVASFLVDVIPFGVGDVAVDWDHCVAINHCL